MRKNTKKRKQNGMTVRTLESMVEEVDALFLRLSRLEGEIDRIRDELEIMEMGLDKLLFGKWDGPEGVICGPSLSSIQRTSGAT